MVFNLFDLVVLDWLVFMRLRPLRVVIPGTEGMAGNDDFRFHLRGFLKGTLGISVLSLAIAGASLLAAAYST